MTKPDDASQWSSMREGGSYLGMRLLVLLYRFGGRWLLRPIVALVVSWFFITRPRTRRYSRYYLQRALKRPVSWRDLWQHQMAFADALADRVGAWMGKIRRQNVAFSGHTLLAQLKQQGRGAVILGAHMGNLEMCRAVVESDGSLRLNVILHNRNTRKFNRIMDGVNDNNQVRLIQVEDISPATAMQLQQMLDNGECVILLADRLPPGNQERFFETPFMGSPARFPVGPFWLALLLGAPVFYMTGLRTPDGHYALMEQLGDGQRVPRQQREAACLQLLHNYLGVLEKLCYQYPYQWFNFYDFWQDETRNDAASAAPAGNRKSVDAQE